jgi:hypothetical protein
MITDTVLAGNIAGLGVTDIAEEEHDARPFG